MIDKEIKELKEIQKEKTRKRMQVKIDPDNYDYYPAKKQIDYYDTETPQRVAIYVRVSTDDVRQTTSFELQKKYYEDFVLRHPNWTLINIYADEGISGTSLAHRDAFNQMIADCKSGKIDLIITKSVSRFARNVMICIGMVRDLAELKHPVGVFFESECIFSLNEDSQMALSFQATMAEEESHTRSRSMETSLRMRLDNGIPLTPKLLGYTHDSDGNLIVNQDEAPTVKLAFYMYLYGYSTQQIADIFNETERKSYLGNVCWTSTAIVQILRNERHCGDVLTRKTFTPNFRDHRSIKNRGERAQSKYYNHHEGIVSRDDFIAVQHMLDNAKYKNNSFLPELKVINTGILKGFVIIYPRWAGFNEKDYYRAAASVYEQEESVEIQNEVKIKVNAGEFDLREFEITRSEFFNPHAQPNISFVNKTIYCNAVIVNKLNSNNYIELLINPIEKKFAIRTTSKDNRQGVFCSKCNNKKYEAKEIACSAFYDTIYNLFEWNKDYKYRINGRLLEDGKETVYIFDIKNAEAFLHSYVISKQQEENNNISTIKPIAYSGKRIRAIPQEWSNNFGQQYYVHEQTIEALKNQKEEDWKLRMDGQNYKSDKTYNTTSFDDLKKYIFNTLNNKPTLGERNGQ